MIVSFTNYVPQPRFDGESWTQVRVEEAPAEIGPWVALETIAIFAGSDSENPDPVDFTTELATLDDGWYRAVFIDDTDDESLPTAAIHYGPLYATESDITPTVAEVAAIARARTKNIGTFDTTTKPTAAQVTTLIILARGSIKGRVGTHIPIEQADAAKFAITLETVRLIEASYYPEQTETEYTTFTPVTSILGDENTGVLGELIRASRYPITTTLI